MPRPPNRNRTEDESLDMKEDGKTCKQAELYKGQSVLLQASHALVSQSRLSHVNLQLCARLAKGVAPSASLC